jgi:hypothetical protein
MKTLHILLACSAFLLLSASCGKHVIEGSGPSKTVGRDLGGKTFNSVEISAPVDAHITVGGSPSLSFDGYANIIPYLRTEVRNNVLRIYVDEITDIDANKNVIANITIPSLTGLDLSGSSDAIVTGPINVPEFSLDVSGASTIDLQELHVQNFNGDMSGSTKLILRSGEINNGSYDVSGSGEISAFGVTQQTASLDLSGSGEAEVNVASKLKVEVSGAGNVRYKGHPAITQDISGAGSVTDAN